MGVLTIPKVLREKLSDEGADALVDLINKADDKQKEDILKFLEEKFEVKLESWGEKLETKLSVVEKTIEEKFERRLAEEIGKVRTEIAESKAEIIKWMFIFIVGQFWAMIGFLFAFFRK